MTAQNNSAALQCSTVLRNNVVRATIKVNGKHPILCTRSFNTENTFLEASRTAHCDKRHVSIGIDFLGGPVFKINFPSYPPLNVNFWNRPQRFQQHVVIRRLMVGKCNHCNSGEHQWIPRTALSQRTFMTVAVFLCVAANRLCV